MPVKPEQAVRFVLDGRRVEVESPEPTLTLLDYLRLHEGRTGTKEGCAEGDCGACTVVLGELDGQGGLAWRPINSCIRFLPTIDGKELVTVESLQDGARLHPVQQALVDHHASQCGFCTPGFVMSLFALYLKDPAPTRERVVEALSGNLCRCTGYRPIVDAGCRMAAYESPARWNRESAQGPEHVAALRALQRDEDLRLPGFHAPRSVDALAAALQAAPGALLLAGGTDIGLWVTKLLRDLPPIIYLGEVAELKTIRCTAEAFEIGAAVPLSEAWPALIAAHPALDELARRFASPPVCNSGTLCGNLANGSPIGDAMPALIALGATIELRCGTQTRRLPLEDFYLGYQKKDLQPGEFLVSVRVPLPAPGLRFETYKLSKRIDQDISAVCAAFAMTIADGRVSTARIAFGGVAATPARARRTEAALIAQPWTTETVEAAAACIAKDFQPLSDLRATSAYRLQTAANLLRRFHQQHGDGDGDAVSLRTHEALATDG